MLLLSTIIFVETAKPAGETYGLGKTNGNALGMVVAEHGCYLRRAMFAAILWRA